MILTNCHIANGWCSVNGVLLSNSFTRLTEEYYKTQSWPDMEDLYSNKLVEQDSRDDIFLILYRELYYRHIYARVQGGPTIPQRFESYYNYCNLFNYILS